MAQFCFKEAPPVHGAMQKELNCEIFTDLIYFTLKFLKRINYNHFYVDTRASAHPHAGTPSHGCPHTHAYTHARTCPCVFVHLCIQFGLPEEGSRSCTRVGVWNGVCTSLVVNFPSHRTSHPGSQYLLYHSSQLP
jgi:hypothetical protein